MFFTLGVYGKCSEVFFFILENLGSLTHWFYLYPSKSSRGRWKSAIKTKKRFSYSLSWLTLNTEFKVLCVLCKSRKNKWLEPEYYHVSMLPQLFFWKRKSKETTNGRWSQVSIFLRWGNSTLKKWRKSTSRSSWQVIGSWRAVKRVAPCCVTVGTSFCHPALTVLV